MSGSPPQAWGKLNPECAGKKINWFTPTGVGKMKMDAILF